MCSWSGRNKNISRRSSLQNARILLSAGESRQRLVSLVNPRATYIPMRFVSLGIQNSIPLYTGDDADDAYFLHDIDKERATFSHHIDLSV